MITGVWQAVLASLVNRRTAQIRSNLQIRRVAINVLMAGQPRRADWSRPDKLEDFLPGFAGWNFDFIDIPALFRTGGMATLAPRAPRQARAMLSSAGSRWRSGRARPIGRGT